jgi:hypothetical protein
MVKRSAMWRQWFGAVAIGAAVLMVVNGVVWGQGAQPEEAAVEEAWRLNDEASRLRGEGKYDQAIPLGKQALVIGEKKHYVKLSSPCYRAPTVHIPIIGQASSFLVTIARWRANP